MNLPHNRSDTSRAAAESMMPHANGLRQRVFDYLAQHSMGLTSEQISIQTGIRYDTVKPRVFELVHKDKTVEDTGLRRPTTTGRPAKVWRVRRPECQ